MADSRKSKLFNTYLSRMNTLKKDKYAAELFAGLESGKNSYMRIDRLESSNFDMTWIKRIEDCIYELGDIIANPKEVTKTVTGIVPVELARKTGAESVQHLASHTQYIKEITDKGDVVPNKILNIGSEEDIHTYENRFIATLVRRLVLFIEKRYEFVKKFSILHDEEILYYKTKAIVDGSEVEIETKVKVRSESDSEAANMSNSYVNRIVKLREYIMYFYGSHFMKELKTERDVRNPIVMTNILRKNTKYHKCYELYRFIEKYDKLGVSYKLDEDASIFSDDELAELNTVMFTNYLAIKARDRSKVTKGFSRHYSPKILTSLDDEQFIYGDLLRGPIEFLRVDEGYQKYLDEALKQDLPPHPTKIEKEYYREELEEKNIRKVKKAALDKLEKRKRKEQADYEKQVRALIAQREKEEQERLAKEAEAARKEQERQIEEVRQALIRDALFGSDTNPEAEEGDSQTLEDETVETPVPEETETAEPTEEQETVEEEIVPEEEQTIIEDNQVEEQPQEEVVEEVEDTNEEPQNEEPESDIVEESVQEDIQQEEQVESEEQPSEEPVEEVQVVVEDVQESEPEVIEEPVQEEIADNQPSEEDIDAIRKQLMEDALTEQDEPVKGVVEEPSEIEPEVVEEVAPETIEESEVIEEETPAPEEPQPEIEEPVQEAEEEAIEEEVEEITESPENNNNSLNNPVSAVKKPRQPRYIKVGGSHRNKKSDDNQGEKVSTEEEPPVVNDQPESSDENYTTFRRTGTQQPRYIKVGGRRKKKKVVEEETSTEVEEELPEEELEKIPGKFIVKTNEGYYVSENTFSVHKHEALVFDDFNEANGVKKLYGGKVVKL